MMMNSSSPNVVHLTPTARCPWPKPCKLRRPSSRSQAESTCSLGRLEDTCEASVETLECGCSKRLRCCGCPQCCRELNNNNLQSCYESKSSSRRTSYLVDAADLPKQSTQLASCSVCKLAERLASSARIASQAPEVSSPKLLTPHKRHTNSSQVIPDEESPEKTVQCKPQNYSRVLSFRQRRLAMKLAPLGLRKRKPAPLPPQTVWNGSRHRPRGTNNDSSDSGNTSGAELNSQQEERVVAALDEADKIGKRTFGEAPRIKREIKNEKSKEPVKLLDQAEIFAIEHFLRSYKSSSYVCGCMANLYLTGTRLDEAGRWSKPASENWVLSKTGVPVLTFDSGLTRNRPRRRLTISLAERGSGFIIWSDTIDHLSNYRAYSERFHGTTEDTTSNTQEQQIDTFHLMYLSTNHRLMAGLSFDDANCARLFLKQVELISSDPANIALTGPKLGKPHLKRGADDRKVRLGLSRLLGCSAAKKQEGSRRKPSRHIVTQQQQANSEYSWSTLRLACQLRMGGKLGKNTSSVMVSPQLGLNHQQQPSPLVSLALQAPASGSPSRRAPRKCDISAPCLFHHVTRVDANCLESLHSRSLVAGTSCSAASVERASCPSSSFEEPTVQPPSSTNNQPASDAASSISSSSSCYSTVGSQHASSSGAEWTAPNGLRPKPPMRRSSSSTAEQAQLAPPPPPPPPEPTVSGNSINAEPLQRTRGRRNKGEPETGGSGKIQAIIRELQAQSLSELVEAKRRLMADIAADRSATSHL